MENAATRTTYRSSSNTMWSPAYSTPPPPSECIGTAYSYLLIRALSVHITGRIIVAGDENGAVKARHPRTPHTSRRAPDQLSVMPTNLPCHACVGVVAVVLPLRCPCIDCIRSRIVRRCTDKQVLPIICTVGQHKPAVGAPVIRV